MVYYGMIWTIWDRDMRWLENMLLNTNCNMTDVGWYKIRERRKEIWPKQLWIYKVGKWDMESFQIRYK